MGEYHLVVLLNPVNGKEVEFNTWYDQKHVPDLLAVDGIDSCTRYQRAALPPAKGQRTYMAIYDIRTNDLPSVMAEMSARVRSGVSDVSPTIDSASMVMNVYEKMKSF